MSLQWHIFVSEVVSPVDFHIFHLNPVYHARYYLVFFIVTLNVIDVDLVEVEQTKDCGNFEHALWVRATRLQAYIYI